MAYKLKKRKKKRRSANLNITSMMDMFTIILVYLIKSYNGDPATITPSANMDLPTSTAMTKPIIATKIMVTKTHLLINEKVVTNLNSDKKVEASGLEGFYISELGNKLKKAREKKEKLSQFNDNIKFEGKALIIADQTVPFETIRNIMFTAGQESYDNFKFAVIKRERTK